MATPSYYSYSPQLSLHLFQKKKTVTPCSSLLSHPPPGRTIPLFLPILACTCLLPPLPCSLHQWWQRGTTLPSSLPSLLPRKTRAALPSPLCSTTASIGVMVSWTRRWWSTTLVDFDPRLLYPFSTIDDITYIRSNGPLLHVDLDPHHVDLDPWPHAPLFTIGDEHLSSFL